MAKPLVLTEAEKRAYGVFNLFLTASTEGLQIRSFNAKQQMVVCVFAAGALETMWEIAGLQEDVNTLRILELLVRYLLNSIGIAEGCVIAFVEDAEGLLASEGGRDAYGVGRGTMAYFARATFEMQKGLMSIPQSDKLTLEWLKSGPQAKQIGEAIGPLRELINSLAP